MWGCSWARSAARVSAGTSLRLTNNTGSPLFTAHAAAGIAYSGCSALATTTLSAVAPRAEAWNASIARAIAKSSLPPRAVVRRPLGRATSPTRSTCAPAAFSDPAGASAARASALAQGRPPPLPNRIGARIGPDIRTEAATAARQSATSTSVTALGLVAAELEGYTARAIPAASATGSAPPTRVVFLVAKIGKPSAGAALAWSPLSPTTGALTDRGSDRPHAPSPPATNAAAATTARDRAENA